MSCNLWILKFSIYQGGLWFRVFGFGLSVQDRTTHKPLFSERYGFSKYLYIGKWKIKWLSPN
jgi:hypothetical protein